MQLAKKIIGSIMTVALVSCGFVTAAQAQQYQRPYRYNDTQMRALLKRLETKSDRFSNLLPNALDRSRVNGSQREDDVNRLVTDFEHATDQLKDRFERRETTQMDAEMVLRQGALINTFMMNRRLDYRTEQSWTQVKTELDRLAATFNIARNWDTRVWPSNAGNGSVGYDAALTGTYRLNPTRSQDPGQVAARATVGLSYSERGRVSGNLTERLTAPQTLAIERRGSLVTLASTRSPQVTFDADGRQHSEHYPNGRRSQVVASFYADQLKVVSNGDRANDFTVTIAPINNGQQLMMTREVYAEKLSRPVSVQSYYDRIDTVARWNSYDLNAASTNGSVNGTVNDGYVVTNGVEMMGRLDADISTRTARNNDRFTMTVYAPRQFEGAVLEGHLTEVDRGGRITGRSSINFDFDTIRLRDGRSYKFAGIVERVTPIGSETARVDNEGAVADADNRTNTTITRTAIGTAVGAIIGAIAGGGKGAAIGAGAGAGAGAGSVYIQGADDLNLQRGSEFTVRASAPGAGTR